jgi:hypothetical protein
MEMEFETLLYTTDGPVCTITLNLERAKLMRAQESAPKRMDLSASWSTPRTPDGGPDRPGWSWSV